MLSAPTDKISERLFKALGARTVIKNVLVANNGIAAVKFIRSVRKWCYEMFEDVHAVKFIAMATPDDLKINAEYIRMADSFIEVPGGSNLNNYANVSLIVDIARRYCIQVCSCHYIVKIPRQFGRVGDTLVKIQNLLKSWPKQTSFLLGRQQLLCVPLGIKCRQVFMFV